LTSIETPSFQAIYVQSMDKPKIQDYFIVFYAT